MKSFLMSKSLLVTNNFNEDKKLSNTINNRHHSNSYHRIELCRFNRAKEYLALMISQFQI